VAVNSFSLSVVVVIFIQVEKKLSIVGVFLLFKSKDVVEGPFFTVISLESFHSPILVGHECLMQVCVDIEWIQVAFWPSFHEKFSHPLLLSLL
jgi:hypothetical protein